METRILSVQLMASLPELPPVLFGILIPTKRPIPTCLSPKQNIPLKFGEIKALMLHVHQAYSRPIARYNSHFIRHKLTLQSAAVCDVYTTAVSTLTRSKRLVL